MNRIVSRLRKVAEAEEMSFEECKQEAMDAIKNMRRNTNRWDVRDTLCRMTSWGFYNGEMMASIDEEVAGEILDQLEEYVEYIPNNSALDEVLDAIGRYAR